MRKRSDAFELVGAKIQQISIVRAEWILELGEDPLNGRNDSDSDQHETDKQHQ